MPESAELLVQDIMVRSPVAIATDATVEQAAGLMADRNIGAVVITIDRRVVGVFTERDLLRRAAGSCKEWNSTPITRFMTPNPVTVHPHVPWTEALAIMDGRHIRHLPVVADDQLVGMLSVRDLLHHRAKFLEALVADRTEELARQNEALTQRERQMTRNLKVAARIQQQLLPDRLPDFPPFRFALLVLGHDQVTGDYHDFIALGPNRLGIIIADASGHGVPAAFVSVVAKMCCTAYCQGLESPADLLRTMNRHISKLIMAEHFLTMFAMTLDRLNLELTYARAGHPLPYLYRGGSREVTQLASEGIMLGVALDPGYADEHVCVAPGDKLVLFTDGVIECRNPAGELFGCDRLAQFLERTGHLPCQAFLRELESELQHFRGGRSFDDDVTVIVIDVAQASP